MADYFTTAELDSPNYRWEHKKIKLFIFSTTEYTPGKLDRNSKKRRGDSEERKYDIDVLRIKENFKNSCASEGIDVDIEKEEINISKESFFKILEGMKNDSFRYYDCYFFTFFTFLDKEDKADNLLRFKGESVSLHDIWEKMRDVPQFQGKPKVFLIQADDLTLPYPEQGEKDKTVPVKFVERRIPIDADRLVILSKLPQMLPMKPLIKDHNPPLKDQANEGSCLIQAFLKVMEKNKAKKNDRLDLLSLTTEINREIKEMIKFIKFSNPDILPYPFVSSTFTKFLYL